jgi:hypothetical protein
LASTRQSPRTGLTLRPSWSRRRHVGASLFLPAVPPTCHKQRSRAVSGGQSRLLREGPNAGHRPLTWAIGTVRNCMACKGSRLWHPQPQIVHMGASGPIRFPKRRSSARTYGASPAAELTRLRRKTDIKAGKGRRRVGVRGRLKGGADGPGTQSPNPAPEQAARGGRSERQPSARLDLHAATPRC